MPEIYIDIGFGACFLSVKPIIQGGGRSGNREGWRRISGGRAMLSHQIFARENPSLGNEIKGRGGEEDGLISTLYAFALLNFFGSGCNFHIQISTRYLNLRT